MKQTQFFRLVRLGTSACLIVCLSACGGGSNDAGADTATAQTDAVAVTQFYQSQIDSYPAQSQGLNRSLASRGLIGSGNQLTQNADLCVSSVQQFISASRTFADGRPSNERSGIASTARSFQEPSKTFCSAQLTALGVLSGAQLASYLSGVSSRIDSLYAATF